MTAKISVPFKSRKRVFEGCYFLLFGLRVMVGLDIFFLLTLSRSKLKVYAGRTSKSNLTMLCLQIQIQGE